MASDKQLRTFISYSRVNKDFALKLAKELRSSGFNIWLDQLDIPTGSRWDDEIERALEASKIFMVILTPASSMSDNVKDEIGYAIDTRKRILPILLENATVPLRLRRFQYVDFTTKSFDEGIEAAKQLLNSLNQESRTGHTSDDLTSEEPQPTIERPVADIHPVQKPVQPVVVEKSPVNKGRMIGILFTILMLAIGVGAFLIYKANTGDGAKVAETPPAATLQTTAQRVSTRQPTDIPGPIVLSYVKARNISDSGNFKGISAIAKEQYTQAELDDFRNNSSPIPVTLHDPGPIAVGYGWCATTMEILYENMNHIEFLYKFQGKVVNSDQYISVFAEEDNLQCQRKSIIIDHWISGEYYVYQEIKVTQKINDGTTDFEPYTASTSFVVTVP